MYELAPCPCGEIPDSLCIQEHGQGGKYMIVMGNCCNEWLIEFHTHYSSEDELRRYARKAWNASPRGQIGC